MSGHTRRHFVAKASGAAALALAPPLAHAGLAFNGTKGRLEIRDFGERVEVDIPKAEGGHGGGDGR